MSEPKDPERLLADALRAQAVFAPHPQADRAPVGEQSTEQAAATGSASFTRPPAEGELPPRYGLLSGAGADSLERAAMEVGTAPQQAQPQPPSQPQPQPTAAAEPGTVITAPAPASAPLPVHWILLLALLLGLAAGSVIGLLTLV
ncbi:hypothetical protein [Amycolatopsis samaneae]|uniref:Uncharacterized protein n=1 Tax=Amycolatopsis samaneae TaxID=664691 RepID=A0ABW5G9D1_9PSEU